MLRKYCTSSLRRLWCFWYCFVCGLWLWNWRGRVLVRLTLGSCLLALKKASEESPQQPRLQHRPAPECNASKNLQHLSLLSMRMKPSCVHFFYERGITHLSQSLSQMQLEGKQMEILLFYLFWWIKEEKLHGEHCWRTGGIGMLFSSKQLFAILLSNTCRRATRVTTWAQYFHSRLN